MSTKETTNHDEIRARVDERGRKPGRIEGTAFEQTADGEASRFFKLVSR